ncbi:MAG: FecR domain-containing protein [Nitrospinaceae bacterium]
MAGSARVIFTVLLTISALFATGVSAEEIPVGKVIGITGTVEFLSGSGEPVAQAKPGEVRTASFERWEKTKFQQAVYAKDQFRTSRKSRLKILFTDKSLIALGPGSRLKIESYLFKASDKLRQGVVGLAHGLSMFIVNKSQKNKNSSFRIVTPTANIAARGTQGYVSSSDQIAFLAMQAGMTAASNSNPIVVGTQNVSAGFGTKIPADQPPTVPKPLSVNDFKSIRSVILGRIAPTSTGAPSGGKPLIEVQQPATEQTPGTAPADAAPSQTQTQTSGFGQQFFTAFEGLAEFFDPAVDFAPVNNPFDASQGANSCTP